MAKDFTINIPDEPFKSTFDLNKTHTVTYTGPRYMVVSIDPTNGNLFMGIEGESNNRDDINLDDYVDDTWTHHIVDAYDDANILHISRITGFYTCQTEIANYEETLSTGEVYDYDYPEESILGAIYKFWQGTYNPATNEWSDLELHGPACTREELVSGHTRVLAEIAEELEDTEGQPQSWIDGMNTVKEWYQNFDDNYGDIDHWKIPYPSIPPRPFN